MKSIWHDSVQFPAFSPLEGELHTDVLIIGGGITGILCAYQLAQAGIPSVLVEADRICSGVSGNTTAKVTAQHGLIYHKLLRRFGEDRAKLYYQANTDALVRYRTLCRDIPCDWKEQDNYVYSMDRPHRLEAELNAATRLGIPARLVSDLPLPFSCAGAVCLPGQGQFHPLKFIQGILPGLRIYEHSPVRSFDGTFYRTDHGSIRAEHVIVATHFPLFNKHGAYFLRLYQHRSYVLALEQAGTVDGMYVDERSTGLSFRSWNNLLLLGGGSHRTGAEGGGWTELKIFARKHYPNATISHRWATQDCMPLDGLPYIGPYSKHMPNVFVATGFQKWGMTSAMVASTLLCDLVQGKENPLADLFAPSRSILHPQLALNTLHSLTGLLTPTTPRCPHMGCALKWNPQEHSWDCPCHGSRFAGNGSLLDNPAAGDLDMD